MAQSTVLVTGSCGLIGSEVAIFFSGAGYAITGIDINHRAIRDRDRPVALVDELRPSVIVHTAAQPSHNHAAAIPFLDFEVNALGTLHLLEAARRAESP